MRRILLLAALVAASRALYAQTPSVRSPDHHIVVDGRQRNFLVDLPPGYNDRQRYALVLDFHGGGGSPAGARKQTGFSALAAREGVIVVYPAGSGRLRGERLLTWNVETCCAYAQREHIDETAFVRAVLDTVQARYSIDPARVYATGLSNGGMMAHLVGCRMSDRFAAIAVVSGELTVDRQSSCTGFPAVVTRGRVASACRRCSTSLARRWMPHASSGRSSRPTRSGNLLHGVQNGARSV